MRSGNLYILLVLTMVAAMAAAGCTTPTPSGPSATATPQAPANTTPMAGNALQGQANNTTAPATSDVPAPANATLPGVAAHEEHGNATPPAENNTPVNGPATLGSIVDLGKVQWYECRITGSDNTGVKISNMDLRADLRVGYKGVMATKYTINTDLAQGGRTMTVVSESYVDPSNDNTLGGHMKTIMNGQVVNEMDIPASNGSMASGQDPMVTVRDATISDPHPDTIMVQAGTFNCTRYALSGSVTGTVWISPEVPVPVRMEGSSSGNYATMELVRWG